MTSLLAKGVTHEKEMTRVTLCTHLMREQTKWHKIWERSFHATLYAVFNVQTILGHLIRLRVMCAQGVTRVIGHRWATPFASREVQKREGEGQSASADNVSLHLA